MLFKLPHLLQGLFGGMIRELRLVSPRPAAHVMPLPPERATGERFFVGRREGDDVRVWLVGRAARELASGRGGWERGQSVGLAEQMLGEADGRSPDPAIAERFSTEVLASLPAAGFVLPERDVQLWLDLEIGWGAWPYRGAA